MHASHYDSPADRWVRAPLQRFINNSSAGGLMLFGSAFLALLAANSPWADAYHAIWEIPFSIGIGEAVLSKSLHHWINDGLMAIFFFVIGLELKRELRFGALSKPADAVLPLIAAAGGMVIPALVYVYFNPEGAALSGWGIPMATDIAFALGVLYLLGDRVPVSLKVFLTALAIADDIGAVLVIAFFYTSEISVMNLGLGALFLSLMILGNILGFRSTAFFAVLGIGGLWLAFLLSGVHATIAAVLAAFAIPARVKIPAPDFIQQVNTCISKFHKAKDGKGELLSDDQFHALESIKNVSADALSPLQKLEHAMHPLVAFVIMPIFAFSNAGVAISADFFQLLLQPVTLGVSLGLLLGKMVGVIGFSLLALSTRKVTLPKGMNIRHLIGAGLLSSIGFTMALFITGLAFTSEAFISQAKTGILVVSFLAGVAGYWILKTPKSNC